MPYITMLRQTGTSWEFENEALLEDFLQRHLQTLLGLKVIAQQHAINGQICDLIAVSGRGQLAILELKNQEDRYIHQQLTRYFDAFLEEQPFADITDYSQPIRLLAIAPSFHRDNFIDRKYSRLDIEFLTFQVISNERGHALQLRHLDTGDCTQIALPEVPGEPRPEVPNPPKALLSLLAKCLPVEKEGILALRRQILSFDLRLQEIVAGGSILYGSGKTNLCAELRYDKTRSQVALFLWLPHRASRQTVVARLRVWTDWQTVSDLAHIPKALGSTITVDEWLKGNLEPLKKVVPQNTLVQERYRQDATWRSEFINGHRGNKAVAHHQSGIAMTFELYRTLMAQPHLSSELEMLTQLALQTWRRRL
jgi:RecB family endonuclease NucS